MRGLLTLDLGVDGRLLAETAATLNQDEDKEENLSFRYKKTHVALVVLSQHEAFVERLSALLGVEGGLVQHHTALLARRHLLAEDPLSPQGQHGGRGRLEV